MTGRPELEAKSKNRTWRVGTLSYSLLGLVLLFAWLLMGDFAWNARERAVTPLSQIMLKAQGASDTLVGILIGSLPAALGMFLSPIIGYRSDRYRSRLGRRIPFLLVSTPIAAASMVGLAFAPMAGSWINSALGRHSPGAGMCFLIFFAMCWLLFEVAAITGNNIFIALINDVVPRDVLGRFFGLFRIISLGVGIGFNFFLMGKAEDYTREMILGLALIYGVGFGLMCLRVKEGEYSDVEKPTVRLGFFAAAKQYFRECFRHPYYLWLFGASAMAITAFTPVNTFSLFYAKSVGLELEYYGKALAMGFVVSLILSYPIGALADRIHPLRVAMGSLFLYLPLCIWGAWQVTTSGSYAFGFAAHVVISGLYFTGTASIGQRLFPKERFAQFASAAQLVLGSLTITVPAIMGVILDFNGRYYPLTFLAGGGLTLAAIFCFFVVIRKYQELGGDSNYQPPLAENLSK